MPLPRAQGDAPTSPTRVLLASSHRALLHAVRTLLNTAGYEPLAYQFTLQNDQIAAETLIEGMALTYHPGLLLLDIDFGEELAGWRLIQALQMHSSTAVLPVVLCIAASAYVQGLIPHLLARQVYVVVKPFSPDDLLRGVESALAAVSRELRKTGPEANGPDNPSGAGNGP